MEEQNNERKEELEIIDPPEAEKPAASEEISWVHIRNICIAGMVGVLFAFYLGAALFYNDHLFANTYINGVPYANVTPEEADQALRERWNGYSIVIYSKNGESAVISAEEIGLSCNYAQSADTIKEQQNALLWPGALFGINPYFIDYTVQYDEDKLRAELSEIPFLQEENMVAPQNAYIGTYNQALGGFEVVSEKPGTWIDQDKVFEMVSASIEKEEQILRLDEYGCYILPEIMSDNEELLEELAYYNKYMQASITYQFGPEEEVVDFTVYESWIQEWGNTIKIDETAAEEYLSALADEYDTYNDRMNFTTIDGYVINLPKGGFGWKMDVAAETERLIEDIKSGTIDTREPLYSCEGVSWGDEIGDFYIEVDMTSQRVYIIDQGEVVLESDCVTGNMANGCTTPPGIFGLTYKTRNATLRGRDYVSYVKYWMPFNGNIGFHDASWRTLFGGDIYLTGGSHGCINLPTAFAARLYDYVYKDCPIICYYLTEDVIVEYPEDVDDSNIRNITIGNSGTEIDDSKADEPLGETGESVDVNADGIPTENDITDEEGTTEETDHRAEQQEENQNDMDPEVSGNHTDGVQ
ncbi:MAG: L,D-transpeptidase/peptidoglycan binding protein [Lachnospiraceae bacterium]|nr:L,D-transpeptidase/peptidoglycan binding protein [Lachnospiraceae bacterium]